MRFPLWLGLRHLSLVGRRGFLGRVTFLAMGGIAIGVATLLTVFAFAQGFRSEVLDRLTGMNPAMFISTGVSGQLGDVDAMIAELDSFPGVGGASPFIQQNGVWSRGDLRTLDLAGGAIRGLDAEREPTVTKILSSCEPPFLGFEMPGAEPGVLLGRRLAEDLGALPGETLTFTTLLGEEVQHFEFAVAGLVESGIYEFDRHFAYVDIDVAAVQFRSGSVDGIGVKLDDVMSAATVAGQLRQVFRYPHYRIATWMGLNGTIFEWMKTMRSIMFVVLSLIIVISGFNISGAMTIVVTEKTHEIGLLLSLGAGRLRVMWAFLLECFLIGLGGILMGNLLGGAVVAWFSHHPIPLSGEVYFLSSMRAQADVALYAVISATALAVVILSTILPSLEVLRQKPLSALTEEGALRA